MDLFPKDYKKSETEVPLANVKLSPLAVFKKTREGLSHLGGSGGVVISPEKKRTMAKLGIILSGSAFILVLLLWGSLTIYGNVLTGQINDLKKKQAEVFNDKDEEMATKIVDLENTSVLAQGLLKSHIYVSKAFDKLAKATLPRVQWQSFELSVLASSIVTKGFTANYETLAKQMLALIGDGFLNVAVSSISMDKGGGVGFNATFNFNPKILQEE